MKKQNKFMIPIAILSILAIGLSLLYFGVIQQTIYISTKTVEQGGSFPILSQNTAKVTLYENLQYPNSFKIESAQIDPLHPLNIPKVNYICTTAYYNTEVTASFSNTNAGKKVYSASLPISNVKDGQLVSFNTKWQTSSSTPAGQYVINSWVTCGINDVIISTTDTDKVTVTAKAIAPSVTYSYKCVDGQVKCYADTNMVDISSCYSLPSSAVPTCTPNCQTASTYNAHATTVCQGNDINWKDNCGTVGSLIKTCDYKCSGGHCIDTPAPSPTPTPTPTPAPTCETGFIETKICDNNTITQKYQLANCEVETRTVQTCQYGCDVNRCNAETEQPTTVTTTTSTQNDTMKQYVPYVIGALVIIIVIMLLLGKKKVKK